MAYPCNTDRYVAWSEYDIEGLTPKNLILHSTSREWLFITIFGEFTCLGLKSDSNGMISDSSKMSKSLHRKFRLTLVGHPLSRNSRAVKILVSGKPNLGIRLPISNLFYYEPIIVIYVLSGDEGQKSVLLLPIPGDPYTRRFWYNQI